VPLVGAVSVVPVHRSASQLVEVAASDAFASPGRARDDQARILQNVIDAGQRHDERLEDLAVDQAQCVCVALAQDESAVGAQEVGDDVSLQSSNGRVVGANQ
jgi:hypothetical protein